MTLLQRTLRAIRGEGWTVTKIGGGYVVRQADDRRVMTRTRLIGFGGQRLAGTEPQGEFSIGGRVWAGLSKLIEEAGEVCQVAGKIIGARGAEDHWDGTHLSDRLEDELADLRAAIDFVIKENELDEERIERRRRVKLRRFEQWQRNPEKLS